jgi:hypothetical protein
MPPKRGTPGYIKWRESIGSHEYEKFCQDIVDRQLGNHNTAGQHRSEKTRKLMSDVKKGEKNPNYGKHPSDETRKLLIKSLIGHKRNVGRHLSLDHRRKIGISNSGKNCHLWRGGVSFGKYCLKFNNRFRRRVRARFEYICVECGKTTEENGKALCVHHVHYDKKTCCKEGEEVGDRKFVALCHLCHIATNNDREFWEDWYTEILNEFYDGKSYLTEEEMTLYDQNKTRDFTRQRVGRSCKPAHL